AVQSTRRGFKPEAAGQQRAARGCEWGRRKQGTENMNFKRLLILTLLTGSCAAQEIAVPQANSFLPEQAAEATREEQTYAEAANLLNSNQWERAAERFNDVAGMKGRRADAGLYWKAYALNKFSRV